MLSRGGTGELESLHLLTSGPFPELCFFHSLWEWSVGCTAQTPTLTEADLCCPLAWWFILFPPAVGELSVGKSHAVKSCSVATSPSSLCKWELGPATLSEPRFVQLENETRELVLCPQEGGEEPMRPSTRIARCTVSIALLL